MTTASSRLFSEIRRPNEKESIQMEYINLFTLHQPKTRML